MKPQDQLYPFMGSGAKRSATKFRRRFRSSLRTFIQGTFVLLRILPMHTGPTYSDRDNKVRRTKNTWKSIIFSTDWIGSFALVGQSFPNVQYHHEEKTYTSCHMSKLLIRYFALFALIARPLDCLVILMR